MTLDQAIGIRKHLGIVATAIIAVFGAALLDSCVARFRAPLFTVHLLPGASETVDGRLDNDVNDIGALRIQTTDARVNLNVERLQTGFWLGGNMWVGTIAAAPEAEAGTFDVKVFAPNQPPATPVAAFRAIVYPDAQSLRRSDLSVLRRSLDIAPWKISLGCLPALGVILGLIYLVGRREDRLLAALGRAEVFLLKPGDEGIRLYFSLSRRHGVQPGMQVAVLAADGRSIGQAEVKAVNDTNAMALTKVPASQLPHTVFVQIPGRDSHGGT